MMKSSETTTTLFLLLLVVIAAVSAVTTAAAVLPTDTSDNQILKKNLHARNRKVEKKNSNDNDKKAPSPDPGLSHSYPSVSWLNQPLRASPEVSNYYCSTNLVSSQHLNESGFIGLSPIACGPFTANFQNSTIHFNRRAVRVKKVTWNVCEGVRETEHVPGVGTIRNSVRGVFGKRIFINRWSITDQAAAGSADGKTQISMFLDGPYARRCDETAPGSMSPGTNGCGWGYSMPTGRTAGSFVRRISGNSYTDNLMYVTDTLTPAATASVLTVVADTASAAKQKNFSKEQMRALELDCAAAHAEIQVALGPSKTWGPWQSFGYGFNASLTVPKGCTLFHVLAIDSTVAEASLQLQQFLIYPHNAQVVFDAACSESLSHFQQAFSPSAAGKHFSGSLPTIVPSPTSGGGSPVDTRDIPALVDWSLSAMISLERIYGTERYNSTRRANEKKTNTNNNDNNRRRSLAIKNPGYIFPRQYAISDGPANNWRGSTSEGNSGSYSWDTSFCMISYTLLDPEFARAHLTYIAANVVFSASSGGAIQLPQTWDSYNWQEPVVALGTYAFDYIAVFSSIQSYVLYSGDYAFLQQQIPTMQMANQGADEVGTPLQVLREIAWAWTWLPAVPQSTFIRDYGSNPRDFLESDQTYRSAVPALNAANAGMMMSLANLLEVLGKAEQTEKNKYAAEIADLRGNATAVIQAVIKHQFNPADGSYFVIHSDGSKTNVRCICDSGYIPFSSILSGSSSLFQLSTQVRDQMQQLFNRELRTNGWLRAVSLSDPAMSNINCRLNEEQPGTAPVCAPVDKVQMRSDWSATGSYSGMAGLQIDALAELSAADASSKSSNASFSSSSSNMKSKNRKSFSSSPSAPSFSFFESALSLLRNMTLAAKVTQPSQGVAVMVPPAMLQFLHNNYNITPPANEPFDGGFPEFFLDDVAWGGPWPRTSRSIQNAVAAINDAIVRSLFGWRPAYDMYLVLNNNATRHNEAAVAQSIDASLWMKGSPRGDFAGTLRWLRTPFNRHIAITAGPSGLSWAFEAY